jgi:hypothetical protein
VIGSEADQKRGEKEQGRPRDHTGDLGVGCSLTGWVDFHVGLVIHNDN